MNYNLEDIAIDLNSIILNNEISGTDNIEHLDIFDDAHSIGCALYYALTENRDLFDCDPRLAPYIEFIQNLYMNGNSNDDIASIKTHPSRVEATTPIQSLV